MKVLHLISGGDKGGAKTHVFTLLNALMEDIEIRVICFMEGVFYQEIKDMDIPSMLIKQRYRNDLTIISKLVRHIREERYHLIHAHGARANFIAVLLRPFIKIPMITTVHSDYRMDFTENLYKKMVFTELNATSLRFLDYYIAVSNNFKEMLVGRKFDRDRIYTVYNSIDFNQEVEHLSRDKFNKLYNIDSAGKTIVGIIGRFDKVKGHEIFIKAAAKVLEKRKDVLFLLAGEGVEQQNLENLAKNLGITKNIKFLGFINDIFSFVNAIDINVLSSYSESFPYVLLEGAKMCKATVSTAVGGIPDLIIEGKTGLLAESGNFEQMAQKIIQLVDNENLRKQLGQNLNIFAKTNFSKESMKNRHIEIYTDVLKNFKEQNKCFDVMLSGYYGFKNSGDEALLKAIIASLREENPNISIIVLSKNPLQTQKEHNVFAINRVNFFQILKYMKRSRLFLNGGGSLIQDITSTHSLIYYTTLMHFAKMYGLKVMLYANGIGPILKKQNIKIAKKALQACNYITLREPESFQELKNLGVSNSNVLLSSDPTFSIKPESEKNLLEILENENISSDKKYFAVSFRQWKYSDANFVSKIVNVIDKIFEKHNIIPVFIPMQQPYDEIISREIIVRLKAPHIILSKEYNVEQLMGIISKMQFVIAMRLHTLIYAVAVGVPIMGIVYDPKIKSFMEYVGQKTYVDCQYIDEEKLFITADDLIEKIDIIKEEVGNQSKKMKECSNNDAIIAIDLSK